MRNTKASHSSMRFGERLLALLLVLALTVGVLPTATLAVTTTSLQMEELYDGLTYGEETIQNDDGQNVQTFVIGVDLGEDSTLTIATGVPNDATPLTVGLTQTTSGQAAAAQANGKNVLAAVNADFFNINDSTKIQPASITIYNGVKLSEYDTETTNRAYFFGITEDGEAVIGDKTVFDEVEDSLVQAVGGGPWLVKEGEIQEVEDSRHPRTAVGIKEDGSVFFVVADGRSEISTGLTFVELAEYMKTLGAVEALNLDGGGSSTAVVKNPETYGLEVMNIPSDGTERPVGNTLLVIDNNSSSTAVDLEQDSDSYYLIEEAADFAQINKQPGANYRLAADLNLNGESIPAIPTFSGTFDGADHTITGLTVDTTGSYALFTSVASTGFIHNLTLEDVSITAGGSCVAALAGTCTGKIEYVTVTGSISGSKQVGGIVGYLGNGGTLQRSSAGVTISAAERLGGLVGETTDNTLIDSCYVNAQVIGGNMAAGVVGRAVSDVSHDANVTNCIVTGSVVGAIEPGGIGGLLKIGVANCIVCDMQITATSTAAASSGNASGLLGAWVNGSQPYTGNVILSGSIVATSQCVANRIGYQATNKSQNYVNPEVTINGQPQTGGTHDNNIGADATQEQLTSQAFYAALGFNFDTVFDWDDTAEMPVLIGVDQTVTPPSSGSDDGLEQDTDHYYLIKTAADLGAIANNPLANYRLAADLDLSDETVASIVTFGGNFDGAGYTISNLTAASSSNGYGLFSRLLSGGCIHDLRLENVDIRTTADYTAALVGTCSGTVKDVTVTGKIYGGGYVGGIVGSLTNGGTVQRCAAGVLVVGTGNRVGGIAGFNDGIIDACYANVNVQGLNNVGGIAGYADKDEGTRAVRNCIVEGSVTASGVEAGGVGGLLKMPTTNNIVKNMAVTATNTTTAVNSGNVAGLLGAWMKSQPNASGNVILSGTVETAGVGQGYRLCYTANSGTFSNNYVNPAVTVNGAVVTTTATDGQQGIDATAEQLTSKDFYAGIGFDFDTVFDWDSAAQTPVLRNVDQTVSAPQVGAAPGNADVRDIVLTVGSDETQRSVTWYSDSTNAGEVQLAAAADMTDDSFPVNCQTFTAASKRSSLAGFYSNQATITDLTADTEYVYRVGNEDGWSEAQTFSTEAFDDTFSFLFVGDPQIGAGGVEHDIAGWTATLNKAADWFPSASFLLSAGDQVENYNNEEQYAGFLSPEVLPSMTLATNIGNHDSKGFNYQEHFNLPNETTASGDTAAGGDYWFSYNGVLFMSLNSNNLSTAEHKAFLKTAIAAYKDANGGEDPLWKIVTFHHSVYSTATHTTNDDILQRRAELPLVFTELGIDAVLMGHDHVYTRSLMMNGTTPVTTGYEADGSNTYAGYTVAEDSGEVFYLTANSASGSKYYAIQTGIEFPFLAFQNQESVPNLTKIDVTSNSLTFTTYRTGDSNQVTDVVDTFTLSRAAEPAELQIKQTYGGNQKGSTPIANSFIELYNPNDEAVSLKGYTLTDGTYTLPLNEAKSIPANGSYLVVGAAEDTSDDYLTYDLPAADQICDWAIDNKSYTITLKYGENEIDTITVTGVSKQKSALRTGAGATDFQIVGWEKGDVTVDEAYVTAYAPRNIAGEMGRVHPAAAPAYPSVETTDTSYTGFFNSTAALNAELIARYNAGAMNAEGGSAEIVAWCESNDCAYVVNGTKGTLDCVLLTLGGSVNSLSGTELNVAQLVEGKDASFTYGDMTSVAVSGSTVAVALQDADYSKTGRVAIFTAEADGSLTFQSIITVGVQPDMVTFTPDGSKLLTANEGEPRMGYGAGAVDPAGSVSVIEMSTGSVTTVDFESFDADKLLADGILLGKVDGKVSDPKLDLEPEYIACTDTTAYISLQEANAIAVLNLSNNTFTGIYSVGFEDFSQVAVDINKEDGKYVPTTYDNLKGIRMPDGITLYTVDGVDYLLTANEGDSRDWEGYCNELEVKKNTASPNGIVVAGKVVYVDQGCYAGLDSKTDYLFGGRSFTLLQVTDSGLTEVYTSGSKFEAQTAATVAENFNCSNDDKTMDDRSGKKGPEPESITVGQVDGKTYAFIALERVGGVMMYDITDPTAVSFVNYINSRDFSADIKDDVSPEGLAFVTTDNKTLLLAACEVSGTLAVYELTVADSDTENGTDSGSGGNSGSSSGSSGSSSGSSGSGSDTATETAEGFKDVTSDMYYYDAVLWAAENGITGGVDDTHFAPNAPCTRAQIVTFLWRAAGSPKPKNLSSLSDVPADAYYAKAVAWALENGITTGTGNGMFSPDATCTRAQAMTFIYRSEQAQGGGMQGAWMFRNPFSDVNLENYYGEAVMWAVANGVTSGTSDTTFSPNADCTRAQIVTFLYRFFVK